MTKIVIVGDFRKDYQLHRDTESAIEHSARATGVRVNYRWLSTSNLASDADQQLMDFDGVWIAPGAPYASLDGAINAIKYSRVRRIPILGTCSGFQHMVVEYARHVLGFHDAAHAEYHPQAPNSFVVPLVCPLSGELKPVKLIAGTGIEAIYGRVISNESFHCGFGMNPEFRSILDDSGLKIVGVDDEDEPRIVMIKDHPFFIGVLFVPQFLSQPNQPHPLISAFLKKAAREAAFSI